MKNMTVISCLFALLISGEALSEVQSVAGTEIAYAIAGPYLVSGELDQDEASRESSGELSVSIGEHLVVRTETQKVSFTPLSLSDEAVSRDSVDAAVGLLNVAVPKAYRGVMTLHQSFGGATPEVKNVCEFLVLDELLNDNDRQSLRQILDEAEVGVVARDGFLSFDCKRGGLEDV